MMRGDGEDGVSEIVSVILMVAVVVTLAAIVGLLVFGIDMPEEPKTVAVTATRSGNNITFINHGGLNMDRVAEIRCWIGGVDPANDNFTLNGVGDSRTCFVPGTTRVVVIGRPTVGEAWVVLDKTL